MAGLQYLRARWYDAGVGRFNRLDDYAGDRYDPQSLHKYGYVHGNPVMGVDPTGLAETTLMGQMVNVAIRGIVATIGAIEYAGTYLAAKAIAITTVYATTSAIALGTVAAWNLYLYATDYEFRDMVDAMGPMFVGGVPEILFYDVMAIARGLAALPRALHGTYGLARNAISSASRFMQRFPQFNPFNIRLGVHGLHGGIPLPRVFRAFSFRGVLRADSLRAATHHRIVNAFKGTGLVPSGHFVKRVKDIR